MKGFESSSEPWTRLLDGFSEHFLDSIHGGRSAPGPFERSSSGSSPNERTARASFVTRFLSDESPSDTSERRRSPMNTRIDGMPTASTGSRRSSPRSGRPASRPERPRVPANFICMGLG